MKNQTHQKINKMLKPWREKKNKTKSNKTTKQIHFMIYQNASLVEIQKSMFGIWLMITSRNTVVSVMNNANNSLSEAFLWNKVPAGSDGASA